MSPAPAANLLGRFACRFCRHDQYKHNHMQGCPTCTCMATPGEAGSISDETDFAILPETQTVKHYTLRSKVEDEPPLYRPIEDIESKSVRHLWEKAVYDLLHRQRGAIYTSAAYLRDHPATQEILRREREKES